MNIAVILAGGSGTRVGDCRPKQFLEVNGRTIMEHTVSAFERHALIDSIIIVSKEEYIDDVKQIVRKAGFKKVTKVIGGGKERYESSLNAIKECDCDDDILLFHDCARPLVSERIITDCIQAMEENDAVTVAVPTSDTIYYADATDCILDIPPRIYLRNAQTPQCFRLHTIRSAYQEAINDADFKPTDDCSVVFHYLPDVDIKIVEGDMRNIKITYPGDLERMKQLCL